MDQDIYEVKIQRYIMVEDCGRMINPMIVDSQWQVA